jgi:hypothetical protein
MKINYISVKQIPVKLLEQRKTEAGYLTISNAALTATDLVQFEKRIGGLNRAATVLNELADVLQRVDFPPRQVFLMVLPPAALGENTKRGEICLPNS